MQVFWQAQTVRMPPRNHYTHACKPSSRLESFMLEVRIDCSLRPLQILLDLPLYTTLELRSPSLIILNQYKIILLLLYYYHRRSVCDVINVWNGTLLVVGNELGKMCPTDPNLPLGIAHACRCQCPGKDAACGLSRYPRRRYRIGRGYVRATRGAQCG
jgi:hypothetical protein